ncbi:hypothetical protein AHMF7605_24785 [Adhaeribacter arboris]|uniref:Alpha/beta hydrolase n=1 Tax=Adhaeribacter arboris TaxID=2072846 RepID=A0A2T2YPK3_9BACT|nr:hypothetical protein [Adhaeribacter arboris]PSR57445.1 hypothetical protein AHMF7605_24785 [Adhaeribacter arboris]
MPNPIILIHGYSDEGKSFETWKKILVKEKGYRSEQVQICSYKSLTNEVTIKDIAEGFDRALRINKHINSTEPFDAIVHSTGILVLRSWLSVYGRHRQIKHIIALAPSSFGSPLAHKGRSWIGAIFKGNKELKPDFLEAGDLVLDGLELGSRFTWDLAHRDLFDKDTIFYGPSADTPYVFTFCGNTQYKGLRGLVASAPGTDGTVRWAGCALNSRKITLDFTKPDEDGRYDITDWPVDKRTNLAMPFIPVEGINHASIIENPSDELIKMVIQALDVNTEEGYKNWIQTATKISKQTLAAMDPWQQFVVRAHDERGDPITDYNLQFYKISSNKTDWEPIAIDVHAYTSDNSYRCFHVNLKDLDAQNIQSLKLEFMASTGTELLGYYEYVADDVKITTTDKSPTFTIDLTPFLHEKNKKIFFPFTTTIIEIILNREPLPLRDVNKIMFFMDRTD